jgi:hypothetical protein
MSFSNAESRARRAKTSAGSARNAATTTFEREMAEAVESLAGAVQELARAIKNND